MKKLPVVRVYCTDRDCDLEGEILRYSQKSIIVLLHNGDLRLSLSRLDLRKPYVGNFGGFEFVVNEKDIPPEAENL